MAFQNKKLLGRFFFQEMKLEGNRSLGAPLATSRILAQPILQRDGRHFRNFRTLRGKMTFLPLVISQI
jgi:hypothetical protein